VNHVANFGRLYPCDSKIVGQKQAILSGFSKIIKFSSIGFSLDERDFYKLLLQRIDKLVPFFLFQLFFKGFCLTSNFQNMGNASSSPKQVQPTSRPSSPEQMQLVFVPSSPDSEPISVSKGPSEDVLPKTIDFIDPKLIRNLIGTGKSIGSSLDAPLLKALASEKNPDRATSRFIADAIGNNGNSRLWLNARFSLGSRNIPKGLSIHLFTNMTTQKILSGDVRSMIIQSPESFELYPNICEFLAFLFSEVSFTNLRCLMFYGIRFSDKFAQWIRKLNLKVFHLTKFGSHTGIAWKEFFRHFDTLERLYIVHPDDDQLVVPSNNLKKLVICCPESSGSVIDRTKPGSIGLVIDLSECRALGEM
jgi:hypothetical protein